MPSTLQIQRRGAIAYVQLSRPDKRNAVTLTMMNELVQAGRTLSRDRTLRAVILHGEGPSFCAGLDFPSVTSKPAGIVGAFRRRCGLPTNLFQEACMVWRRVPVPVIAVLHGHCLGAGLQLALGADFRIATPDCDMAILEARWGLIPDMSGSVTLRELLPMDQAKLLTMTGRIFKATEALQLNLVTQLDPDPLRAAEALADELAARSPDAIAATKRLFHSTWTAGGCKAFHHERVLQLGVLAGSNQRAAMKAAMKKVQARFGERSWWW
jgi:enoyl-CoA hydratase/carnithine racemase